jgi:prevent-host-death family protein
MTIPVLDCRPAARKKPFGKSAYFVYFIGMTATLTELRRDTSRVMRSADKGGEIILTEHGEPRYRIKAVKRVDRKAAAAALRAIGPVEFLPRK